MTKIKTESEIDVSFLTFFIEKIGIEKIDEYLTHDNRVRELLNENETLNNIWSDCLDDCRSRSRLIQIIQKENNDHCEKNDSSYCFDR